MIIDGETGREHRIEPGVMWVAERGGRFLFKASEPTWLICVFNPPFEGHETGSQATSDELVILTIDKRLYAARTLAANAASVKGLLISCARNESTGPFLPSQHRP